MCGGLLPFAFAPFGIFPLAVLCPGMLFLLLDLAPTPAKCFKIGFSFGFAGFLGGLYWLYISLHTFGHAPLFVAIPLMLGTVAIMASYLGMLGWIYGKWFKHNGGALRYLVILPAAWVLLDWLRGWLASGFPWLSLGYSQTDTVLGGLAPIVGVFGITYLVVLIAGSIVFALRQPRYGWLSLLVIVVIMSCGAFLRSVSFTSPVGPVVKASLIQGSISQDRKWLPEQFQPTLNLYRDLTRENWDSDLIIWPEAAVPTFYRNVGGFLGPLLREARQHDSAILLGIPRRDNDRFYNSVVALGQDRVSFYDKRHLVPFGEYFPVPKFVRNWMRLRNLPYSDYQSGDEDQQPLVLAGQRLGLTICYEDVFGEEQLSQLDRVTLLVNVSNDAWFGDSIAPHQHVQIARMRAMEAERFLLRATNTGVSAFVGPKGRLLSTSPQFETHVLNGEVQGLSGLTPYARLGNWLIVLWASGMMLLGAVFGRKQIQRDHKG